MAFKGRPPGSGSGEMSRRTQALRPAIALTPQEAAKARRLRRRGLDVAAIATQLGGAAPDEVEKALVQMRSPRPETTRGTLNVTLAAHRFVMAERRGDEPIWQTIDRLIDELIGLRAAAKAGGARPERRRPAAAIGGADDAAADGGARQGWLLPPGEPASPSPTRS
jgi:hypothetical protein